MDTRYLEGEVRDIPKNVDETRTIPFVASTKSKDRHKTVLNQDNWSIKNFNNNSIIGYQHNVYGDPCRRPDPNDVIGKGRAYYDNGQLMVDITFEPGDINPEAETIFKKIKFGSLRAVSVGFLPIGEGRFGEGNEAEGRGNETFYYDGQELLEVSVVNIPSNAEALKKSLRSHTAHALMYLKGFFGEEKSFSEIEKMTVGEVIKAMDKNSDKNEVPATKTETSNITEAEQDLVIVNTTSTAETIIIEQKEEEAKAARITRLRELRKTEIINQHNLIKIK